MKRILATLSILAFFAGNAYAQEPTLFLKEAVPFVKELSLPSDQDQTLSTETQTIYINYNQNVLKDGKVGFYMWIDYPEVHINNTTPDLMVGYNVGPGAAFYVETTVPGDYNMMFFVENYGKGDMNFPLHVLVYFGGSRHNDIHIRLPEGYTAKVHVNSIQDR